MAGIKIGSFCLSVLVMAASARSAIVVNIGHDTMAANSTASFPVSIVDTDYAPGDDIEGMTFTLQVSNGSGSTPSITSVDLLTNTVFTGLVTGSVYVSSGGSTPQFVSEDLLTDNAGEYLGQTHSASGTLATITFNTNGATARDYNLEMTGTLDPSSDSQFINGVGNTVPATFNLGTLTVQAVTPEPIGISVIGMGSVVALQRRQRRSR